MASLEQLLLVPPMSANPRLRGLTEARLEEEINAIYSAILDYNGKERAHAHVSVQSQFGWHVSLTLNGNVGESYVYKTSCVRAELVFLCVTYACTVCYSIHSEFVLRSGEITKQELRRFFVRLYGAYLLLRDVAKPQLQAWTTGPPVPQVAECSVHTTNFLISLCAGMYGISFCKLGRLCDQKPGKALWARLTLFVAERFETCYSILQERVWPVYGRQHRSADKLGEQLAGYALCYRTKCYAALLHEPEFADRLMHRQTIALARCTEYLVAPLRVKMFGFDTARADEVLDDMRRIVEAHLVACEAPLIGVDKIDNGRQFAELMSLVAHLIPKSDNIMDMPPPDKEKLRRFTVVPRHGAYNPLYHTIRPEGSVSAQGRVSARKPRFELDTIQ